MEVACTLSWSLTTRISPLSLPLYLSSTRIRQREVRGTRCDDDPICEGLWLARMPTDYTLRTIRVMDEISSSSTSSSECSVQGYVLHCKLRNQGRSSAQRQAFHRKLGTQVAVLLWIDRCGSFPLLSAPHSLFSIWTDHKKYWEDPRGTNVEVRIVDLANWGLRTSSKFTTGFLTISEIRKSQSAYAPGWNIMKGNERGECGEIVLWNLCKGKTGETPRKTYPKSVSCTTKTARSDRDANSGPHWWERAV